MVNVAATLTEAETAGAFSAEPKPVGLWLSVETNAPPGATIAVVSGVVFALAMLVRSVKRSRKASLAAAAVGASW